MNFFLGRSANSAPSYFCVVARVLSLVALLTCVWAIGGHYPFARFTTLSLLALSIGLFWIEPLQGSAAVADSRGLMLTLLCVVVVGLAQIFGNAAPVKTGVQTIRAEFAQTAESDPQFTISTWHTKTWLSVFGIGVGGFFLAAALFNTEKSRLALLGFVSAVGASQVMWGIIQTVRFPELIVPGLANPGGSQPFGSFLNRNHGADFLGMSLVCTIGLLCWFYRRDLRSRIGAYQDNSVRQTLQSPVGLLLWIGSLWLAVGLAISFSRGAWLSVLVALGLTYACWKQTYKFRPWLMILLVAMVTTSTSFAVHMMGLEDRLDRRLDSLEMETALSNERLTHWREALPAVEHYLPFGSGLGTYGYAYLPFGPVPENGWFSHAHNQYLEVVMEAGIPGVIILVVGLWLSMGTCLKLCRSDRSASEQGLGVAAFGAMVMQATHAVTDFGLMMPANLLTLSLLVGAASGAGRHWGVREARRSDHVWSVLLSAMVTAVVTAAVWHQMACVRAESLESLTHFSPATPAPNIEQVNDWISQVETEMERSPDNEELLRRLIQLRLHRVQRTKYDSLVATEKTQTAVWNYTSLNGLITRIYANQNFEADTIAAEQNELLAEVDIQQALKELQRSLALNPLQPRTHYRIAQISVAAGMEWKQSFANSMRLSVVDPQISLGNGLLAWAMGDQSNMIQQWKQTLNSDPTHSDMIFSLARQSIDQNRLVEELMPDRWVVPYHLAVKVGNQNPQLSGRLFKRADQIAEKTLPDESRRVRAQALIAIAQNDFQKATILFAKAIVVFPKDPDLRYQYSSALLRSGNPGSAADQARIAMNLRPGSKLYRQLFERARDQHRRESVKD